MSKQNRFFVDGQRRYYQGIKEQITESVYNKYAKELHQAGFFKRMLIRLKIRREILQELETYSPPSDETLY